MSTVTTRAERVGSGWLLFAGLLILLLGLFNAIEGLFAIFNDKYVSLAGGSIYIFDSTGWGWLHLLLGLIQIAVGAGILAGQAWARGAGIGLAVATALIQMIYLPIFPWWSLINIALCVLVIYALVVPPHGAIAD
jgi:hypothetical protein